MAHRPAAGTDLRSRAVGRVVQMVQASSSAGRLAAAGDVVDSAPQRAAVEDSHAQTVAGLVGVDNLAEGLAGMGLDVVADT